MKSVILNGALQDKTVIDDIQKTVTNTLSCSGSLVEAFTLRQMKIA